MSEQERRHCEAVVWVRDISRYSGRGRGGFSLYYRRQTCKGFVGTEQRLCWQHRRATVPSDVVREACDVRALQGATTGGQDEQP